MKRDLQSIDSFVNSDDVRKADEWGTDLFVFDTTKTKYRYKLLAAASRILSQDTDHGQVYYGWRFFKRAMIYSIIFGFAMGAILFIPLWILAR